MHIFHRGPEPCLLDRGDDLLHHDPIWVFGPFELRTEFGRLLSIVEVQQKAF